MEQRLISGRTIAELYAYLQSNGGSYNDLRILFQHSDIRLHKDVEHFSTRNRDIFLNEYIQPLCLTELDDAQKLVRFIEMVIELPDEPNSANPEAKKLLASLQQDGWQVVGNKISLDVEKQIFTHQDKIVTMPTDVEELLTILIKGLPRAMYPLTHRRKDAPSLQFDNEYDLQDLTHTLLRPWIADIRPEEHTPSHAGSSARIDFVLTAYNIVIETKYVRDSAHAKKIGDELIIDIAHYRTHPQCKQLWIVIHDPHRLVRNPDGLISDLENQSESIEVRTFIV